MQNNLREIWDYLSRCMFAGMGYSHAQSVFYILTGYAFVVAPPLVAASCVLSLAAGASGEWSSVLLVPSLLVWATQVAALTLIRKNFDVPFAYALTTPLGLSLFYTALLVSMIDLLRGKGLAWKARRVYERAGVELPTRRGRTVSSSSNDKSRV